MENRTIKYTRLNYGNLSEKLVFTDIDIPSLQGDFIVEDDFMIKQIHPGGMLDLNAELNNATMGNPDNVQKILLLFPSTERQSLFNQNEFNNNLNNLIQICCSKFINARISLSEFPTNISISRNRHVKILEIEKDFTTGTELRNFIVYNFGFKTIRHNYARCHHFVLRNLEKRCHDEIEFSMDDINQCNFYIRKADTNLFFRRNSSSGAYSVFDSSNPDDSLLELTNDHLLGMYNPCLLFDFVACLSSIKTKIGVKIVNNEIMIVGLDPQIHNINFSELFKNAIAKFDLLNNSKKFKIQLGPGNFLVLNRCLKISLLTINFLLDKNITEMLIELAWLYFKCFSITPICCRMQSIAQDAIVYDFEKYTYYHLHKYLSEYVTICKLLFPFVNEVDCDWFDRTYLEIIPVSLIQRLHGSQFRRFTGVLVTLKNFQLPVVPLANGNFRVGSYININSEMLTTICNPEELNNANNMIMNEIAEKKFEFVKAEDIEFDSSCYFEYKNVFLVHDTRENSKFYEVRNIPLCKENNKCCHKLITTLVIFSSKNHHFAALKFDQQNLEVSPADKLDRVFSQAFKPSISHFLYSACHTLYGRMNKTYDHKTNAVASSIPLEKPLPGSYDYWIYKERFLFEKHISVSLIESIVSDLMSFEEVEGVCLAFVKNKIVTVENLKMAITEVNCDYYKATADFCFYNNDDISKFFHKFKEAKITTDLDGLDFEITPYGLINFLDTVQIEPSTFLNVRDSLKLLKIIKELSAILSANLIKCRTVSIGSSRRYDITESFIELSKTIAEKLNPLLNEDCDFMLSNFCCVPPDLFNSVKKSEICQALQNLRNEHINFRISPIVAEHILLDNICVSINVLQYTTNFFDLISVIHELENINAGSQGTLILKYPSVLELLQYDDFDDQIFANPILDKVNKEVVKKCLEYFENSNVKSVVLAENRNFEINKGILLYANLLSSFTPQNRKLIYEVAEKFGAFLKRINFLVTNNLLSLKNKNVHTMMTGIEKFKKFFIVDTNKKTYLQLGKTINDSFHDVPPAKLESYEWLEFIPKEVIMGEEKVTKLLHTLNFLKEKNLQIWTSSSGKICTSRVELSVATWLQIKNDEKFVEFSAFLNEIPMINANRHFNIFSSGLFSMERETEVDVYKTENIERHQQLAKTQIQYFLQRENVLPITINSGSNIMVGHTIWSFLIELYRKEGMFLELAQKFNNSVDEVDKNLMKSIHDLVQKRPDTRKDVLLLIKMMNKNLQLFSNDDDSEKFLFHQNLRIFPSDLWDYCSADVRIYDKAIKMLQKLNEQKIAWFLKLNGNIELESKVIVTFTNLLSLNNEEFKFYEFCEFLRMFKIVSLMDISCKRELENTKSEKLISNKISSYADIIRGKKLIEQNDLSCRIEHNGVLFVNKNLWVRVEDVLKENTQPLTTHFQIPYISKMLRKLFPGDVFQYGHPSISILTSLFTSTEEQVFDYCNNLCNYITENYDDDDIQIEFISSNNLFRFNNLLSVHPRSFFHLQSINEVIRVLKKYNNLRQRNPEFLKHIISDDERNFCKELWKIKKDERLEFNPMRDIFLKKLGKIIWDNKEDLKDIGNINNVLNIEKEYYGIEEILVKNELILQNGNSASFLTISENGNVSIRFKSKYIIDAFKFAENLNDAYKCCNASDYASAVESVSGYSKFIEYFEKKNNTSQLPNEKLTLHEQIYWLLDKMNKIQNENWVYKFSKPLKVLHHWIKHPHSFQNLNDFYTKMNDFFTDTEYNLELDAQRGDALSRRYEGNKYFGVYGIPLENGETKSCVITFFYCPKTNKEKQKGISLNFDTSKLLSKYLVITDTNFTFFVSNQEISLHEDIVVKTLSASNNPNFISLTRYVENTTLENKKKIEKVLLFLQHTTKNENEEVKRKEKQKKEDAKHNTAKKVKEKTNLDYNECLRQTIKSINENLNNPEIIICYPSNLDDTKKGILESHLPNKFSLYTIDAALYKEKRLKLLKNLLKML